MLAAGLSYRERGPADGPVALLLHGEPSWSFLYRHVIRVLADAGIRCVAPDLVGFGRSDKPAAPEDHTFARHVEWVRELAFDHLDLGEVTLVGQDWGGLIGLRLVAEQPGPGPTEQSDDTLLLMFLCCHPDLSPASAVALTLRAVGGLTTREIAEAFLVPEATMAQRISRAKRTVSGAAFTTPADIAVVLRVLYLIFNEGYGGRGDLAADAIRLGRALAELMPDEPEVHGLLAMMLLLDARREASARAAVVEERARIAREIHDVLAHTLSALAVQLEGTRLLLEQRPGDAMADRAGLAGHTAALDLDHRVEPALGPGDPEGHADLGLVDGVSEVLVERAAVHDDLALTGQQADASDRRLAATCPGVESRDRHFAPRQASGSGCWA